MNKQIFTQHMQKCPVQRCLTPVRIIAKVLHINYFRALPGSQIAGNELAYYA